MEVWTCVQAIVTVLSAREAVAHVYKILLSKFEDVDMTVLPKH